MSNSNSDTKVFPSTDDGIQYLEQRARWGHWTTLFFYCALLLLFSINQWFRAEGISLFQWSIQCGPLLMLWFGLRKKHRKTYLWLCLIILLYFIKGVEGVMGLSPDIFDVVLLVCSVSIFLSSMMTARWLMQKASYQATHQTEVTAQP